MEEDGALTDSEAVVVVVVIVVVRGLDTEHR
eukprot:COSAG06_NODE_55012_length_291_cov_5.432292_2_plen_30_part_01